MLTLSGGVEVPSAGSLPVAPCPLSWIRFVFSSPAKHMQEHRLLPPALAALPQGQTVARILAAALTSVEPAQAIQQAVCRQADRLWIAGQTYDLNAFRRIRLLAVGKAAAAMGAALGDLLGERLEAGLLIPKQPCRPPHPALRVLPGDHPVPGAGSLRAGQAALDLVAPLTDEDLLLCAISGGGSALMTAPLIPLPDLQTLTTALLACGARIDEINILRRHLDHLKGGGLARAAAPAQVVSLILSDVVGNPLEAIASGPTAPDPTTQADALAVLRRYHLLPSNAEHNASNVPMSVPEMLHTAPETPKPGAPLFERVRNVLVGSNAQALTAGLQAAQRAGFHTHNLGDAWQGEARQVALTLCHTLLHTDLPRPFCMAAGGETTVTLRGDGLGGRNQELALAAVEPLTGAPDVLLVTLATDGEDGPTDAAGAIVSGQTLAQARALGLAPAEYLARNDAWHFFDPLGALLRPGSTGTNVNDLTFLFGF